MSLDVSSQSFLTNFNSEKLTVFERGLLVGIPLGAMAGPNVTLMLFIFIFCYDFGFYRIAEIGQQLTTKYLDMLKTATSSATPSQPDGAVQPNPFQAAINQLMSMFAAKTSLPPAPDLSPDSQPLSSSNSTS